MPIPELLFIQQTDVFPQDLGQTWSPEIQILTCPIAMKFDRHIDSSDAEMPVKFHSDTIIVTSILAACQVAACRVAKKSLFIISQILYCFLYTILCYEHPNPLKTIIGRSFHHCRWTAFSNLALWRHHRWPITSHKSEALVWLILWRHIRRLFFHTEIGWYSQVNNNREYRLPTTRYLQHSVE